MTNSKVNIQQVNATVQELAESYKNGEFTNIEELIAAAVSVGIELAHQVKIEMDEKYRKESDGGNL